MSQRAGGGWAKAPSPTIAYFCRLIAPQPPPQGKPTVSRTVTSRCHIVTPRISATTGLVPWNGFISYNHYTVHLECKTFPPEESQCSGRFANCAWTIVRNSIQYCGDQMKL